MGHDIVADGNEKHDEILEIVNETQKQLNDFEIDFKNQEEIYNVVEETHNKQCEIYDTVTESKTLQSKTYKAVQETESQVCEIGSNVTELISMMKDRFPKE